MRKPIPLVLGLVTGGLAGFLLQRRLSGPGRMPHLELWRRALADKYGEALATRLVARAQTIYDELKAQGSRPAQRALRFHLHWGILPGLALYRALLEENSDRQAALAEMESLPVSATAGLRRVLPYLGLLPDPFAALRFIERWTVRLGFPPEGWDFEPVEDSEDRVAFDVHRCFYLDTLTSYGAPELTPSYCIQDDVLFAMLPPSITWERTNTLGRGGDRCDFRWCRGAGGG